MMEDHEFCDKCPGCRPALATLDGVKVGKPFDDDTPEMKAINKYWDNETEYRQRKAYIEVTLHNSRRPGELALCKQVMAGIQEVLENLPK